MNDNENTLQELTLLFQDLKTERSRRIPNTYRPLHEIRHEITDLVMSSRDAKISEFLVRKLEDPNYQVRSAAIEALSKSRDGKAVAPLLAILKNEGEESELRIAAAHALGHIGDVSVVPILIDLMRDKGTYRKVIWACADALGLIGDPRAIDPLIDALVEDYSGIKDNSDIRDATRDALVAFGGDYVVGRLLELLAQEVLSDTGYDTSIRMDIIVALGEIKNPLCIERLLQLWNSPTTDSELRLPIMDALANFRNPRVVAALQPALDAALNSNDSADRFHARRVLAKLGIDVQ
jgi:HEAT repeat protein